MWTVDFTCTGCRPDIGFDADSAMPGDVGRAVRLKLKERCGIKLGGWGSGIN